MQPQTGQKLNERHLSASRRSLIAVVLISAIHYLAVFLLAGYLPHRLAFLFFLFTLVIVPGLIISFRVFPRLGWYFRALFSFVLGTGALFILIFLLILFRLDLFYAGIFMPVISVLMMTIFRLRSQAGLHVREGFAHDYNPGRRVAVILLLILAVISVMIISVGDPLIYPGDSPDQIAYIRTVSRAGEAFPEKFLHIEGGELTRDVRKGLVHSMWGLINLLTGRVDVITVWPLISMVGSVFLLLGIFCLGVQYFRSGVIGLLGVILFILYYHGGLSGYQLITVAYGFPFGKVYFFAFLILLPAALRKGGKYVLILAAASSFAATGTHVTHIMLIALAVFIFVLTEYFQSSGEEKRKMLSRNLPLLAAAVAAVNLPYLLLRYLRDYKPANVIHTHKQGVFILWDYFEVVNPVVFLLSGGALVVVALFAVFILWKRSGEDRNLRFLLSATIAVYIISFNPLWVSFLMDRISYLVFRFETAAATMIVSAYFLKTVWDRLIAGRKVISPARAVFGAVVILIALVPPLISLPGDFAYAGAGLRASRKISAFNLSDLYSAVDKLIPEGSVIASDPVTSYCIPAFCDQFVVCTYDQHSIPNDSTALDRILACRDIYLPMTSCREVSSSLEKYHTDYVVINGRIPPSVLTKYWRPGERAARRAEDKLIGCNKGFTRIYNRNEISIFSFESDAAMAAEGDYQQPDTAGARPVDRSSLVPSGTEGIYISDYSLGSRQVQRGDTLTLRISWIADREIPPSSYRVHIRFDTDFPRTFLYSRHYGKIYRKFIEMARGERYRFRRSRLPFNGVYPPDRWPTGREVKEEFRLPVPEDIAAGTYIISVRMGEKTQYPNYTMKDIFTDQDIFDGADIAKVIID